MINIKKIIETVTLPVMGCTEPASIALASSLAARCAAGALPDWVMGRSSNDVLVASSPPPVESIEMIHLRTTRNLFKNAMAVGIPNTGGESGLKLAAALGPFLPAEHRLKLLKYTDSGILSSAHQLIGSGRVRFEVDERDEEIFVEARFIGIFEGERHVGEVILQGRHDGVHRLSRNGLTPEGFLFDEGKSDAEDDLQLLSSRSLAELMELAKGIDSADRKRLLRGSKMNMAAARIGLEKRQGLGIGAVLSDMADHGELGEGLVTKARIMTAAAADARMSGLEVEIFASSGSGNQGIMASIPVVVLAEHLGADDDRLAEALALGHLLTAVMTQSAGLLGGMCGCVVKAGIGAAASCTVLLSEDQEVLGAAINNMAGNIVGEICDGAKAGCALKMATAAGAAVESALFASRGLSIPPSNGIVGLHALDTLKNIGEIARGMHEVDRRIVEIMRAKA